MNMESHAIHVHIMDPFRFFAKLHVHTEAHASLIVLLALLRVLGALLTSTNEQIKR